MEEWLKKTRKKERRNSTTGICLRVKKGEKKFPFDVAFWSFDRIRGRSTEKQKGTNGNRSYIYIYTVYIRMRQENCHSHAT